MIGDWLAAETLLTKDAPSVIATRAADLRERRHSRLLAALGESSQARLALLGLLDLGAADLPQLLLKALRGSISGVTSAAISTVAASPDTAEFLPEVYKLFQRAKPDGEIPQPHVWVSCAAMLLKHGYRTSDVLAVLPQAGGTEVGEAALVALEYAPSLAISLFRKALRFRVPMSRTQAAAVLALIDEPWSRAELLAVLSESDEQEPTADCRAALAESRDPDARRAVIEWEERNPHEPETGRFISMDEMSLRMTPGHLTRDMEKLRERVLPLRGRMPPTK